MPTARARREITDVHEIEQDKHYVERFQLIPVDEQTYTYEHHTGGPSSAANGGGGGGLDAAALVKREAHSAAERDAAMQDAQQQPTATVYMSQPSGDVDVLRYTTAAQVRYDDEVYHQAPPPRYEYQPHAAHAPPDEIKVELVRHQQQHHHQHHHQHAHGGHSATPAGVHHGTTKLHIYEPDGTTRTEVSAAAAPSRATERQLITKSSAFCTQFDRRAHRFISTATSTAATANQRSTTRIWTR